MPRRPPILSESHPARTVLDIAENSSVNVPMPLPKTTLPGPLSVSVLPARVLLAPRVSVPPLLVVAPVNVLTPVRVRLPAPVLLRLTTAVPFWMTPEKVLVTSLLPTVSRFPAPVPIVVTVPLPHRPFTGAA